MTTFEDLDVDPAVDELDDELDDDQLDDDQLDGEDPARPRGAGHGTAGMPLFYLDGATEGTLQWKAETFQLVNWGGFEGRVEFDFHPGATLISGASGTGKSTLLDAYIALMMPSDTPFNGASNDAVAGRARGADQRNLLSYLRGKVDTTTDRHGREVDQVLRGKGAATWGAVGMTFVNDHGHRFTALRVYYVPARATRTGEITMRMATHEGRLDLAELGVAVEETFAPKALRSAFPGLRTYDTYSAFAHTLHTRLGIGANGDGAKALRLLVRIQSGHQIRTVDELYKEMVLERPATFAAADRAIEHFDDLEAAYLAMQTEQAKADLLAPITDRYAELTGARAEIEALDTFGLNRDGDTPLTLWRLRTEAALLDAAVDTNRVDRSAAADQLLRARARESDLDTQLEQARDDHRNSGGAALERLAGEIEAAQVRRDQRLERRDRLVARIGALDCDLGSAEAFTRARADGTAFLADLADRQDAVQARRDALLQRQWPLEHRLRELREERASLEGRSGRVPKHLDDLRRTVADAVGVAPADLPFLAELIDVSPDEGRWRAAIETVLGGAARQLLVPDAQFEAFSAAIDPLRLRGRLTFVRATLAPHQERHGDPDHVAGKLVHQDSPFSAWVHEHVSAPARNALCVETPDELRGEGYRVTLAGQTRQGDRGSHGRQEAANIIGFSNTEALAELDEAMAAVEKELARLTTDQREVETERDTLDRLRTAYEALEHAAWEDIDVAGVEQVIDELEARRQEILGADDRLKALEEHIGALTHQLRQARETVYGLKQRQGALDEEHGQLVDRQDEVSDDIDRVGASPRVALDEAQSARLDKDFAAAVAPGDPASLADFGTNLGRLVQRLRDGLATAQSDAQRAEAELERTFAQYKARWEDPNLGERVESYPDYARILENIRATGLHQRHAEWRRRLTDWSGQDLVPLSGAMDAAIEDIEDRLHPINDILRNLPFGAGQDRLRIKLRRLSPDHVTTFRKDLRALSSAATRDLPESQMEARFKDLQAFMAQIRRREDPRANAELGDRDRLLDVRRHVEITAERYGADGRLLSTYTVLGGKSGGESQELVAFIVGAALRFRLGDDERTRPRYAPVFLDEGFVKSDAEFAGRAVEAWKGLGFQLIVGAPLDKVTALEPHMDELLAITKNTVTHYAFVHRLKDVTAGPEA